MTYFLENLLPTTCKMGVFLPFRDGWFGADIHAEALLFEQLHRSVWGIRPSGELWQIFSVVMKPLSVEETRRCIRDASGVTISY